MEYVASIRALNKRQLATQAMAFLMVMSSALMIYKGLQVWGRTESPIIVVLSGSMEPAFYRGDLLFLSLPRAPVEVGDICVFKIKDRGVPIVHRVIKAHNEKSTGKQFLLTKGDNNPADDRGLYNPGQLWIHKEDIVGCVTGQLPYIGIFTIFMNDYPQMRYIFVFVLGLFFLTSRE